MAPRPASWTLGVAPPDDPSDPLQRTRFLRDLLLRCLLVALPLAVVLVLLGGTTSTVLALVAVAIPAADLAFLQARLVRLGRRERRS